MAVQTDIARSRQVASLLYHSFRTTGIHGNTEMPEDIAPTGVACGSLEHILFITQTVSIDYQRDANVLWESSRQTYLDPTTRYLFQPKAIHERPYDIIVKDMQKHSLSKKPRQDAYIWKTGGVTFYKKWQGDPRNFLADCDWDAIKVLARLKTDSHLQGGRSVPDYPFLRGDKIGPLWLRMLRDNVGIVEIQNLDKVPIPVDIHVARATMALGVVRGEFKGKLDALFVSIRQAWFEGVEGLKVDSRPMIALDIDEPLWHLSKYGCTYRDKMTGICPVYDLCEAKEYCIKGRILIKDNYVELII